MTLNSAAVRLVAVLLIFLFPTFATAEEPADLRARVEATYGFRPRDLDAKQLEAKSAELDVFWNFVKSQGDEGVRQLRSELRRGDSPAFFRYDGAKLLLSVSTRPEDRNLALQAIALADVQDIQPDDYFFTVHQLAVAGFDTTAAAMNILNDPEFTVFVPLHALTLRQDVSFLYMLLPTDEAFYRRAVIDRLNVEQDPIAMKTILLLLSYLVTRDADEAIQGFAVDERRPAHLRELAASIVRSLEQARVHPLGRSRGSYDSLKAARRRTMTRVSDEALHEMALQTLRIRHKQPR